jgi:hypothetical protein
MARAVGTSRIDVPELLQHVRVNRRFEIGFPGATDQPLTRLAAVLTGELLNNIGDPTDPDMACRTPKSPSVNHPRPSSTGGDSPTTARPHTSSACPESPGTRSTNSSPTCAQQPTCVRP